jgi:molybdate transport system ATP-binding protein
LELGQYLIAEFALLVYFHQKSVVAEVGFHERGRAAEFLVSENLLMPPLSFLQSGKERPSLDMECIEVRIPNTTKTVGPISAAVQAGKILGIIGPNGAGKSTLLKAIAGHMPISNGFLRINGHEVNGESPFKRRVSTVFQDAGLIASLSGDRNIALGTAAGAKRLGRSDGRALMLIEAFGLSTVVGTQSSEVSIGERQLIALIRALVSAPHALLLDEPTASIDTARRRVLSSVIRELISELRIPAIVVSHDTAFLFQVADDVMVLDHSGKIVAQGRAGDYVSGGSSIVAADLTGAENVLRITDAGDDLLVLDDWLMLPSDSMSMPVAAAGIKISSDALTVRHATPGEPGRDNGHIVVRGVIRSRQYFPHGDFIMFEPIQTRRAGIRLGRARGLMLARAASQSLSRMHVDLLIDQAGITWLS